MDAVSIFIYLNVYRKVVHNYDTSSELIQILLAKMYTLWVILYNQMNSVKYKTVVLVWYYLCLQYKFIFSQSVSFSIHLIFLSVPKIIPHYYVDWLCGWFVPFWEWCGEAGKGKGIRAVGMRQYPTWYDCRYGTIPYSVPLEFISL